MHRPQLPAPIGAEENFTTLDLLTCLKNVCFFSPSPESKAAWTRAAKLVQWILIQCGLIVLRFLSSETLFDNSKCLDGVLSTPTPNLSEANGTVAQKQMAKFTKSFRNSGGKGAWCTFSKPVVSALLLLAVKALGSDASTDQRSGKATKRPGCREVGTSSHRHLKKSWISRIGFWLRHLFPLCWSLPPKLHIRGRVVQWFHDVPCQLGEISPSKIGRPNHRNASSRQSACNVRLPQSTAIRTATTL